MIPRPAFICTTCGVAAREFIWLTGTGAVCVSCEIDGLADLFASDQCPPPAFVEGPVRR